MFAILFNAARGKIKDFDIKNFYAEVERQKSQNAQTYNDSVKLAVLHHHPLPIPYSGSDTHLVLNDAASLLLELAKYDIDLVIHDHKHFSSFAKITFQLPDGEYDLPVLAAGSASKTSSGDPRGNSYNLIRVWDDGVIDAQTFFVKPVGTFVPDSPVICQTLERASEKLFLRERRRLGCCIDSLDYRADIDVFGDAHYNFYFNGLRSVGGEPLKQFRFRRRTDFGYFQEFRIIHQSIGLAGASARTDFLEESDSEPNGVTWSIAECEIDLGKELTRESDPVSFGLELPLFAGYAMSLEEQRQQKGSFQPGMEYTGIEVCYPIRRLDVTVESPHYHFTRENVDITVSNNRNERQARLEQAATEDLIVSEHRILLRVQYPRYSYSYVVRWKVPDDTPKGVSGDAQPWRRFLLERSHEGADSRFAVRGRAWLEDIKKQFVNRYTAFDPGEHVDLSIMVFDEENGVLQICASTR